MGVTTATWRKVGYDKNDDGVIDVDDIRLLSKKDAMMVLQKYYWDRWAADCIQNQAVANMLVDWVWASGRVGIVAPQKLLGVVTDGIVGPVTLAKVNQVDPVLFLQTLYSARITYLKYVLKRDPSQSKFIRGWLRRLNDFI